MIRPKFVWPSLTTAPLWLAAAAPLARTTAARTTTATVSSRVKRMRSIFFMASFRLTLLGLETPAGGTYSRGASRGESGNRRALGGVSGTREVSHTERRRRDEPKTAQQVLTQRRGGSGREEGADRRLDAVAPAEAPDGDVLVVNYDRLREVKRRYEPGQRLSSEPQDRAVGWSGAVDGNTVGGAVLCSPGSTGRRRPSSDGAHARPGPARRPHRPALPGRMGALRLPRGRGGSRPGDVRASSGPTALAPTRR